MNDWEIKKFLRIVLSLQLAIVSIIFLDTLGFKIPILREIIGFFYLTFIPGIVILRIFNLHKLGNIETLLYTVGLSIATLMFTGLFMNTIYPFFGIHKPISVIPLVTTISIFVLVLCILCYIRDKNFSSPSFIYIKDIISNSVLVICLLPFLSIFGTYLVNFYDDNIILFFLIVIISIIPISIIFFNKPKKEQYALSVFIISISLLYHWSLISTYLTGADIHYEYHYSNAVYTNSFWDTKSSNNVNAMLSIVMLAPIYSIILNTSIIWIFKIIYPLLYSFVPLGLYYVFQKYTNKNTAILSVLYFMFSFPFFSEMLQLARQEIAELFYVLLIMLIIDENIKNIKRSLLLIIFAFSLVVSHYGISYIYMISIILIFLINIIIENINIKKICIVTFISNNYRIVKSKFVFLFVVFALTWYIHVSNSSAFISIVNIGNHIITSIFTDFFSPNAAQALAMVVHKTSIMHEITKYLYIISQFFIVIGIFTLIIKPKKRIFPAEYNFFSIINIIMWLFSMTLPYFASALNTTRLYHITLFFLAPFIMPGITTLLEIIPSLTTKQDVMIKKYGIKIFSIYLSIFFLFNSGIIYEITNDKPFSIALNNNFDFPRYCTEEVLSAKWTVNNIQKYIIYADLYSLWLLNEFQSKNTIILFKNIIEKKNYLYIRKMNIKTNSILLITKERTLANVTYQNLSDLTDYSNKIYSNGASEILYFNRKWQLNRQQT